MALTAVVGIMDGQRYDIKKIDWEIYKSKRKYVQGSVCECVGGCDACVCVFDSLCAFACVCVHMHSALRVLTHFPTHSQSLSLSLALALTLSLALSLSLSLSLSQSTQYIDNDNQNKIIIMPVTRVHMFGWANLFFNDSISSYKSDNSMFLFKALRPA